MKIKQYKSDIIFFVNAKKNEQLEFLIDICNQNSFSSNKQGVDKISEMILNQLEGILPIHEIDHQKEGGNHHILRTKNEGKFIYLVGHMDTVFPPNHVFQTCQKNGDILTGPGTGDMKGGLTIFIYALKALHNIGLLKELPISLIFNGDEELGARTSHLLFEREREKALICLVSECAGLKNEIVISRNGKLGAQMKSYGKARHVGMGTFKKSSAVLEMANKVIALEALNNSVPDFSINVGKVEGGLNSTTIAAEATGYIDMRWKDDKYKEIILDKIKNEMKKKYQSNSYTEFEILNNRPAMPYTGANKELINLFQKIGKELGQKIPTEHRCGTSDANFFGSVNVPTIDGLGPISEHDHTENEYIKIASLYERTELLAILLMEYAKTNGLIS